MNMRQFSFVMVCFLFGALSLGADRPSVQDYQNETKVVFTAPAPLLSSVVAAQVQMIHYRFGESFEKGEPLVTLDSTFHVANVEAAEAAFAAMKVKCDALNSLYEDGNATLMDREQAFGGMKVAQKNLVEAREKLRGCKVCAPFDGRVVGLAVEEHELVEVGRPLLRVVNDTTLLALFLLPEAIFAQVKTGIPVKIYVTSTQEEIEGIIKYISAEVDPASATFEVRAEVDNRAGHLRTGMNARLDREHLNTYLK